jgi:glycolate oxidase FAD binding subunit
MLAIQNSKLAHSALQICCGAEMQPRVDVLFEGTEAGLAAQVEPMKSMMGSATITDVGRSVWGARQEICSAEKTNTESAVVKVATLPTQMAETIETISRLSVGKQRWSIVAQATGIGWGRIEGETSTMESVLRELRAEIERGGGSLVIAHGPARISALDAWGNGGDTLPLMRAVKWQFDPRGTLNPGRFVGGI